MNKLVILMEHVFVFYFVIDKYTTEVSTSWNVSQFSMVKVEWR